MKVMRGFAVIDSIFQQATFKGIPLCLQILKKKHNWLLRRYF